MKTSLPLLLAVLFSLSAFTAKAERLVLVGASYGKNILAITDAKGRDETQYLEPLLETVVSGRTPAEEWLDAFTNRWDGRIEPLFTENAY